MVQAAQERQPAVERGQRAQQVCYHRPQQAGQQQATQMTNTRGKQSQFVNLSHTQHYFRHGITKS
jgi:hypothetical protein